MWTMKQISTVIKGEMFKKEIPDFINRFQCLDRILLFQADMGGVTDNN